jgi:tRNA(Ile2)-agmatinylcytidine synthase
MTQEEETTLHVGFDDTDSLKGSCTTHLATKIIREISNRVTFLDYPRLIRNNPNVPWKTRGNGAIGLSFIVKNEDINQITSEIKFLIENYYQSDENTNPGLVVVKGEIPDIIKQFSRRALIEVITIAEAKEIAKECCFDHFFIGNGRGLIGGLAAIGNTLNPSNEDFTYEILTYRIPANYGSKRRLEEKTVYEMDKKISPNVFNNIDEETNKILICPAGPDPVFYGIRGEEASYLLEAMSIVKPKEPLESFCIFRTNQGTDQHFYYADNHVEDFRVFKGTILITEKPRVLLGGHIILRGQLEQRDELVDIAAFEPSKSFRKEIGKLLPNDRILAYGGIKFKKEHKVHTIQLEKCEILTVSDHFKESSPYCPKCSKRMTSAGHNKGHKCKKCGYKDSKIQKIKTRIERELESGLLIPPAQAQRHLVKPHQRYKLEKKRSIDFIENWCAVYPNKGT